MRPLLNSSLLKPNMTLGRTFYWPRTLSSSARMKHSLITATSNSIQWKLSLKFFQSKVLEIWLSLHSRFLISSLAKRPASFKNKMKWSCRVPQSVISLCKRTIQSKRCSISWGAFKTISRSLVCPSKASSHLALLGVNWRKQRSWTKARSTKTYWTRAKREGCGLPIVRLKTMRSMDPLLARLAPPSLSMFQRGEHKQCN